MSSRIKKWDDLIMYMQNNPGSILIKSCFADMPLVIYVDGKRTELYLREPLPLTDERLEAKPHNIDGKEIFGMMEFRIS